MTDVSAVSIETLAEEMFQLVTECAGQEEPQSRRPGQSDDRETWRAGVQQRRLQEGDSHPHRLRPLRVRLFWRLFHPTASQGRDDSVVLDGRIVSEFRTLPRLLVAGMSGGSGKTLVALGLLLSLRRAGVPVRAFKKGPDYIDAAWLSWASGQPARNLDTYLMGAETILFVCRPWSERRNQRYRGRARIIRRLRRRRFPQQRGAQQISQNAGGDRRERRQGDPHRRRASPRMPETRS